MRAGTGPARLFEPLRTHDCSAEPGSVVQATLSRSGRRGQSLVEATLVLFAFFALLLGIADCGQVLFAHQSLVERARGAVRWGSVHPWEGPQPIVNLVLYGQTQEPAKQIPGYLGMTASNVQVLYQPATPERPDDETVSIAIVNFESHLYSPWLSRVLVSPRPVLVSAPVAARAAAAVAK